MFYSCAIYNKFCTKSVPKVINHAKVHVYQTMGVGSMVVKFPIFPDKISVVLRAVLAPT